MSREKSDSDKRRVIVDLSWPKAQAVNDFVHPERYVGVDFALTLPNIDHVVKAVRKFGKDSYIAKIDISRAFKHIPIDPKDINFLGLHWKDYFIEKNLVFGFKHGSQIFQRLSESIRFILTQENHYMLSYMTTYYSAIKLNVRRLLIGLRHSYKN